MWDLVLFVLQVWFMTIFVCGILLTVAVTHFLVRWLAYKDTYDIQ